MSRERSVKCGDCWIKVERLACAFVLACGLWLGPRYDFGSRCGVYHAKFVLQECEFGFEGAQICGCFAQAVRAAESFEIARRSDGCRRTKNGERAFQQVCGAGEFRGILLRDCSADARKRF